MALAKRSLSLPTKPPKAASATAVSSSSSTATPSATPQLPPGPSPSANNNRRTSVSLYGHDIVPLFPFASLGRPAPVGTLNLFFSSLVLNCPSSPLSLASRLPLQVVRSSGRIPKEIPILLIGSDLGGKVFSEHT